MYQCTHDGNCGMDVHTRVQIIAVTNIGSDHAYSVAYSKRRSRRQLKNILNWNIRKTLTSARNFHKNSWEGDKFSLSWLLLRCLSFLSSSFIPSKLSAFPPPSPLPPPPLLCANLSPVWSCQGVGGKRRGGASTIRRQVCFGALIRSYNGI